MRPPSPPSTEAAPDAQDPATGEPADPSVDQPATDQPATDADDAVDVPADEPVAGDDVVSDDAADEPGEQLPSGEGDAGEGATGAPVDRGHGRRGRRDGGCRRHRRGRAGRRGPPRASLRTRVRPRPTRASPGQARRCAPPRAAGRPRLMWRRTQQGDTHMHDAADVQDAKAARSTDACRAPVLYVVVPCYNEQEVLPVTSKMFRDEVAHLVSLGKVSPESRILFVDDGSADATWGIVCDLSRDDPVFRGISPLAQPRTPERPARRPHGGARSLRHIHQHRLRRPGRRPRDGADGRRVRRRMRGGVRRALRPRRATRASSVTRPRRTIACWACSAWRWSTTTPTIACLSRRVHDELARFEDGQPLLEGHGSARGLQVDERVL